MSEAIKLIPASTKDLSALAGRISEARNSGVPLASISKATGVNRALISTLVNHGFAALSEESIAALWKWADQRQSEVTGMDETPLPIPPKAMIQKTDIDIIPTHSYMEGLGMCQFAHENKAIAVLTGKPGTGKTTIVNKLKQVLPRVIAIEAWPMMRLNDLLSDIADGLGIRLTGSQVSRVRQIERALKNSDVTLVVDEAEMLRKWDNDKLEVLRKIWDHTGISLILFGTPMLLSIVSRMNTTQLSRRMFSVKLSGATAKEIRKAMDEYAVEAEAADALAQIAADTDHGGMGTWNMMMRLCLKMAKGGPITMDLVREAKMYKPGL